MKTSQLLRDALALIDTKNKWIQGVGAADSAGWAVVCSSSEACKFCSAGAIEAAASRMNKDYPYSALNTFRAIVGGDIPGWNDSTNYETVTAAFKQAIALAEASEIESHD